MMNCIDGRGRRQDHAAEGWLCAPDGSPIQPSCRAHAQATIREYAEKLGESWTFTTTEES